MLHLHIRAAVSRHRAHAIGCCLYPKIDGALLLLHLLSHLDVQINFPILVLLLLLPHLQLLILYGRA